MAVTAATINVVGGFMFTDRMLNRRGREETLILGSDSLRPIIRQLLPEAEIVSRPRFSTLRYAGSTKLSRLPPRSAVVAFSAEQVYALAEMLRRFKGGAAVVMGALSPARVKEVRISEDERFVMSGQPLHQRLLLLELINRPR